MWTATAQLLYDSPSDANKGRRNIGGIWATKETKWQHTKSAQDVLLDKYGSESPHTWFRLRRPLQRQLSRGVLESSQ